MKSQRGITLTSLVIYMSVFMLVLAIMSIITNSFYKNINTIKEPAKYVTEFNKFSMLFIQDVKKNESCSITGTSIEFPDGTIYSYGSNAIYRNGIKIAKNVKSLQFTPSTYVVNDVTKNIINVDMTLGQKNEEVNRNIDFVLKYW